MKREVIQDFLNLPGIAGVALMDGRSRPYFCGVDQTLNFQQKEALAQGIIRVVETIPDGFETFEFQFTGHQVHIYKLERGIILLVLTRNDLVYADYLQTIKDLKAVLQADITNAIATFRLIAGNVTNLSNPSTTNPAGNSSSSPASVSPTGHSSNLPPSLASPVPSVDHSTALESASAPDASLKDVLVSLNHFSNFTAQYLGTHVIINYWKSTRPSHDWLRDFQIDRSAQFTFTGSPPQGQQTHLTTQEQYWVQEWVAAFIKRCSQVIRDFPTIVEQKALNDAQKALLLGDGQ